MPWIRLSGLKICIVFLFSATTFWYTETLTKCFTAWANARTLGHVKADALCKKHMLQKGLQTLRFAVHQQKQAVEDFQAKIRGRLMAKYWLKVGALSLPSS